MPDTTNFDHLTAHLKSYVNTKFELLKLESVERTSGMGSVVISNLVAGLLILMFLFFISLGAVFFISDALGNYFYGCLIVAGFYLVLGIIILLIRKRWIEQPLRDKIIRNIFN